MNNNQEHIVYTYTSLTEKEKAEVEEIRRNYLINDNSNDKVVRLKKLNKKVETIPLVLALSFGILGVVLFGLGLAMVISLDMMTIGIVIGVIGLALIIFAYPVFNLTHDSNKKKYEDEIISLAEEILKQDK